MIDVEMLRPTADEMLSGISAGDAMKRRLLFKATAVDQLPQVADEMLGGLHATPALRHRILVGAERAERARTKPIVKEAREKRPGMARLTPAMGMALVLSLMIGLGAYYGNQVALPIPGAEPMQQGNLATYGMGGTTGVQGVPQFRSLFEGEGANPPIIGMNGRYFRMLSVPVPKASIGTQVSEINEFTDEPALASTVGTVSNVVQAGAQVFAVDGISSKTAVIAEVDGVPRLFQRVGYASGTIVGRELFEDTLDVNGQVTALELSGVGIITDEVKANELIYMLSEFAAYHGTDLPDSDQALTIYLDGGLSLQLLVQGDVLSGCGAWSCPEFFEMFEEYLAEDA